MEPSEPPPRNTEPRIQSLLRTLPQVAVVLQTHGASSLAADFPHARIVESIRRQIDLARAALLRGETVDTTPDALAASAAEALRDADQRSRLRRVINATGIVIHTNMGRAPLAEAAIDAVAEAARRYSNLELDLATGRRGDRASGAEAALRRLTGAEAAVIVNNNAAAVLLALAAITSPPLLSKEGLGEVGSPSSQTLFPGQLPTQPEVIISRGEMVEIGGSFRIPDVLRQSGAKLVEVGATNRTHLRDYAQAINADTRAILKVHASNYRITGYTKSVPLSELATLADARGIVLMEDLGSGALIDLAPLGLPAEPTPRASIAAGAHVVAFSGDKLLGGPQAGLIVGRKPLIGRMSAHPLYRAVRPDKLCLAALDATLACYERDPTYAAETVPVLRMLTTPSETLRARAETLRSLLAAALGVTAAAVEPTDSYAGGGTLPELALPSYAVRIEAAGLPAAQLAGKLRAGNPPVIGVIADEALRLDVRTLADDELELVASAVRLILASP